MMGLTKKNATKSSARIIPPNFENLVADDFSIFVGVLSISRIGALVAVVSDPDDGSGAVFPFLAIMVCWCLFS